jgi:hypothetical protein
MEKFKKVILVLGPIVLLVGLYITFSGPKSPVPGTVELVNVFTGKIESIAQSELTMIPATDSDGRLSLYPIVRTEDGKRVIGERYRSDLTYRLSKNEFKKEDVKIDLTTFTVPN